MLSLFKKKTQTKQVSRSPDLEMGIVVSNTNNSVVPATPKVELPGLQEALEKANHSLSLPTISAHTAVTAMSATGNLATEIYALTTGNVSTEEVLDLSEDLTKVAIVSSSCNMLLSNGLQIKEYILEQRRIQRLQKDFINSIQNLITDCYFLEANGNRIDLTAPLTAERIMPFMYKHGVANFSLTISEADFTLQDNSFTSTSGKYLAAAVSTNAIFTTLNIANRLGVFTFSEDPSINTAFRMGTSLAANAPLVDTAGALLNWSKCQNRMLLEAIAKVINVVYLEKNALGDLPLSLIDTLDGYISKENMAAIRQMRDDAHRGTLTTARSGNRPTITG